MLVIVRRVVHATGSTLPFSELLTGLASFAEQAVPDSLVEVESVIPITGAADAAKTDDDSLRVSVSLCRNFFFLPDESGFFFLLTKPPASEISATRPSAAIMTKPAMLSMNSAAMPTRATSAETAPTKMLYPHVAGALPYTCSFTSETEIPRTTMANNSYGLVSQVREYTCRK
jgi:hypothetical protein